MNRKKIVERIKDRYGTVKHFCKKKGINYGSFRVFLGGKFDSEKFKRILKEEKIA
jgi:hypothetical protein